MLVKMKHFIIMAMLIHVVVLMVVSGPIMTRWF